MSKPDNRPRTAQTPKGPNPRIEVSPESTNAQTPVWSIASFDHDGEWGVSLCRECGDLWEMIFSKLRHYESMSWNEIERNRKRDHSVPVHQMISQAQSRLKHLRLDDEEELFRFRLDGTGRVWGIREGRVFKILWWDPEHEICPSTR